MSSKPKAAKLATAIEQNFREPSLQGLTRATRQSNTRTTFTAPSAVVVELRVLALRRGCTMNDLLLLAVSDLLASVGHSIGDCIASDIRQKIRSATMNEENSGIKDVNKSSSHSPS